MAKKYSKNEFNKILKKINLKYNIFGPVLKSGKDFNLGKNLIIYDEITDINQLEWKEKSTFSPKDILYPPSQVCFNFSSDKFSEPVFDDKPVLIFLRACDICGIENLDSMFLENGGRKDFYYSQYRKKCKFILIECNESFENCFCVSLKGNRTSNYSIGVKFHDTEIFASVNDEEFESYFKDGILCDYSPEFINSNKRKIDIPDFVNAGKIYYFDMWRKYDTECVACGRCNAVCISCSCFATNDVFYADNPSEGKRIRTWVGCHNNDFTVMAGGLKFRRENGERMRYKALHKVHDFKKKFGRNMCVGCGRCDDNCHNKIEFFDVLKNMISVYKSLSGH
ncbi:MAG TPA: anaerobic sulfite reductase subunit AsrA [Victivallales bacterium]|nr:anaerobic sulfite reductase subunit AsrA [Victivallales bacterium]